MRPNLRATASTTFRQWASSARSPGSVSASRPASSTTRAVCFASSCSLRYEIATWAPSRANASATARPIPLSPPVISAMRSFSRPSPLYDDSP